jgi:hypothetical protein
MRGRQILAAREPTPSMALAERRKPPDGAL